MREASRSDQPRALAALVGLGVIGALGTFSFLPLVVGQAIADLGFSERAAGFLAAAEMAGGGAATFLVSFFVHRQDRRRVALFGLLLIVSGSAASLMMETFAGLMIARATTGVGEGSVIAAVIASMAGTRWPERNFGLWTIVNMAMASLLFFLVMPRVLASWGLAGVFATYLLLAMPGFLLLAWYPERDRPAEGMSEKEGFLSLPIFLSLLAILAAHLAHGGIWAYMERIGIASGVSQDVIGRVLGSAAFAGLVGGLLVTVLGSRFGRVLPNAAALVVSLASLVLVIVGGGIAVFVPAAMAFYLAWVFGLPYLMGLIAALDPAGRAATLAIVMQNVGLAAGPAIAGSIVSAGSYVNLAWFGLALYLFALVIAGPLARRVDKHGPG